MELNEYQKSNNTRNIAPASEKDTICSISKSSKISPETREKLINSSLNYRVIQSDSFAETDYQKITNVAVVIEPISYPDQVINKQHEKKVTTKLNQCMDTDKKNSGSEPGSTSVPAQIRQQEKR